MLQFEDNNIYCILHKSRGVVDIQQTCDVDPTLVYCWPTVYDVGPTVNQGCANVSCLLGCIKTDK